MRQLQKQGKRTVIACWSEGSRDRLGQILEDHGLGAVKNADTLKDIEGLPAKTTALCVLGIEHGFELNDVVFIGEQDILGDRLVRKSRRKSKGANVITEATGLSEGDLVVHVDHGIGRFIGLKTIEAVARRMTAWNFNMPVATNSIFRSKTSSFCPAMARKTRKPSSTSSVAVPGRHARPSSRSAFWKSPTA